MTGAPQGLSDLRRRPQRGLRTNARLTRRDVGDFVNHRDHG